jgi:hypothetical protein
MATNANPFIVNLVDLQNINTSITGVNALSQLQTDVANIQEMVQFTTKTLAADTIKNFTEGKQVQIQGMSNIAPGIDVQANSISFTVGGNIALQIEPINFSTTVNIAGWLYVSESAFVKNLYQTSDRSFKRDIEPFFTTVNDVLKLEPRKFTWKSTGEQDLGFIAQDVQEVWPSLTTKNPQDGSLGLSYSRFIPLLLESIRELNGRVSTLEGLRT